MMRTPDYQRDGITLYCGDCLDILPKLSGVAIASADPPYGIGHKCNYGERKRGGRTGRRADGKAIWKSPQSNNYTNVIDDDKPFDPSAVLGMSIPTILWGGNHFASRLPDSGGWLVWDKERPDSLDQATCELAWTNCIKGVRRFRHLWNGMMRASEHGENYHPTQKPVALFTWVLSLPWIPEGVVFDPYMGSGPQGVACVQLGREFIGIEKDPAHFATAVKRIEAALNADRDSLWSAKQLAKETQGVLL